ncbi:large ribosomal subunit protein bL28m isoform X2 [Cylas formicarius]|uniref:large ribosomal subunit protein bL28m isoform X2 n=1 Tax=Cylas formicarius TaxID=197179 RepID=UPI0029589887|nr:large ribosomal subunit protein bL28m isoform X2 [Cylas formicarius]
MASNIAKSSIKTLGVFQKHGVFREGVAALLPDAYKKFYKEWRLTEPAAVHYVPELGKYKRDEITGEVSPIENRPIPLIFPKEHDHHIWGGEGIIQGFRKTKEQARRVPHFWVPTLRRSVVYSEVLNKYFSVVVTERAINLINANYGFDHYLLKTPACDLRSLLPLGLKRHILKALQAGCPAYKEKPEIQNEVLKKYEQYLKAYTAEEIDWYGYSLTQACKKLEKQMEEEKAIPLKQIYRVELLQKLRAEKTNQSEHSSPPSESSLAASWIHKMNPFGKKQET